MRIAGVPARKLYESAPGGTEREAARAQEAVRAGIGPGRESFFVLMPAGFLHEHGRSDAMAPRGESHSSVCSSRCARCIAVLKAMENCEKRGGTI
ncbi:hypothetical protein B0H17DRAFT_3983 [Mycena rosella]|uniref:Uncharacterized protein n=1 Tax=Mycena rosella TaxID=1033263 RepID=A0AAD7H2Y0_MYCRO|nr:hypothetical protein B0H17DRAFT_3983 [Mycena rosella]